MREREYRAVELDLEPCRGVYGSLGRRPRGPAPVRDPQRARCGGRREDRRGCNALCTMQLYRAGLRVDREGAAQAAAHTQTVFNTRTTYYRSIYISKAVSR